MTPSKINLQNIGKNKKHPKTYNRLYKDFFMYKVLHPGKVKQLHLAV